MKSLALVALLAACGDDGAAPADAPAADSAIDAALPAATGTIALPGCAGIAGVADTCRLVTNASACSGARCSRLVVMFSGGESGCGLTGYTDVMADYASHGWAAICIDAFESSTGSGQIPYLDEAPRYDFAIREATTGAWATAYWTGEDLLFEGISHGASAPLIAMVKTTLDDQPHWKGTRKTAGCFFDGTYDQFASAEQLRTGAVGGGPCTLPVPYSRWLERYCGAGATTQNCNLSTHPKAMADTITGGPFTGLALTKLRLIECGSALAVCPGDILPAAPIMQVCTAVAGTAGHACDYATLPSSGHTVCHRDHGAECRPWFEAL